jgi:hypothetical protein
VSEPDGSNLYTGLAALAAILDLPIESNVDGNRIQLSCVALIISFFEGQSKRKFWAA